MGQVISIVSGKGGTGKSFFAANMGALLAMNGKKVVLIDMDLGMRNLDIYLGLEDRVVYNIMDVLSGMCRIKQALIRDKRFKSLYLMSAAPPRDSRDITGMHMQVLCNRLKKDNDFIIIDGPSGIDGELDLAIGSADTVVVVTEPEPASIRDADILNKRLLDMGKIDRYCVVNKVKAELMAVGAIPSLSDITRGLRMKMAGFIQYDDNMLIANNSGVPIVLKLGTYIEKNFTKIVKRIIR